jgi:hypothetical protein
MGVTPEDWDHLAAKIAQAPSAAAAGTTRTTTRRAVQLSLSMAMRIVRQNSRPMTRLPVSCGLWTHGTSRLTHISPQARKNVTPNARNIQSALYDGLGDGVAPEGAVRFDRRGEAAPGVSAPSVWWPLPPWPFPSPWPVPPEPPGWLSSSSLPL